LTAAYLPPPCKPSRQSYPIPPLGRLYVDNATDNLYVFSFSHTLVDGTHIKIERFPLNIAACPETLGLCPSCQ